MALAVDSTSTPPPPHLLCHTTIPGEDELVDPQNPISLLHDDATRSKATLILLWKSAELIKISADDAMLL